MAGMEFLKACTTNVRVVDDIFQMQFKVLESPAGIAAPGLLHKAIAALREQRVLCTAVKDRLWVFGRTIPRLTQLADLLEGWKEAENATSVESLMKADDGRAATDVLLDAIEGSISFSLSTHPGIIHLHPWAWLLSPVDEGYEHEAPLILRVCHTLTESGTLYLFSNIDPCPLRPIRLAFSTQTTFLACCGRLATLVPEQPEDSTRLESRETLTCASDTWTRIVTEMLAAEGVSIDQNEPWATVELQEGNGGVPVTWPARLCLTASSAPEVDALVKDRESWTLWFGDTLLDESRGAFKDPLVTAEQWFLLASTGGLATGSPNVNSGTALSGDPMNSNILVAETPLATSPPFNQRTADLHAAMSGIYPTPPDGLLAGPGPLQNETHSDPLNDPIQESEMVQFAANTGATREGNESPASSNAADPYQSNTGDLFGDMGEMELGANEVGDADFDYFDDPDEPENDANHAVTGLDPDAMETDVYPREPQSLHSLPIGNEVSSPPSVEHARTPPEAALDRNWDDSGDHMPVEQQYVVDKHIQKPLSPFGIRERLLPPPVPASVHQQLKTDLKRSSSFGPLNFNEELALNPTYIGYFEDGNAGIIHAEGPNISLPPKRRKSRIGNDDSDSGVDGIDDADLSGEDSEDDMSLNDSDHEPSPPRLPWVSKKRKWNSLDFRTVPSILSQATSETYWDAKRENDAPNTVSGQWQALLSLKSKDAAASASAVEILRVAEKPKRSLGPSADTLTNVAAFYGLTKMDLIYVAQVIAEQAGSTLPEHYRNLQTSSCVGLSQHENLSSTVGEYIQNTVDLALPGAEHCGISKLALTTDITTRTSTTVDKTSQTSHSRPSARESNVNAIPSIFPLPAPHMRVHRGADKFDLLPPALTFWTALGLGPVNGCKDIKLLFIAPDNGDLVDIIRSFSDSLGKIYEGCKFGNLAMAALEQPKKSTTMFDGGILRVGSGDDGALDLTNVLKEYAASCIKLGKALAKSKDMDRDHTMAICILNPFEDEEALKPYLCACFWLLYKAYRHNSASSPKSYPRSDLALQLIPLSAMASAGEVVVPDSQFLTALAFELYDRSPPSPEASEADNSPSQLPISGAPAFEVATVPPKRVGFQLSADPPGDILHEGSILHVAYTMSGNGQWLSTCSTDSTGHSQRTSSVCMRGQSFRETAARVWEETLEIVGARDVMWRIYIATTGEIDASIASCWRKVVTSKPRKQMLHVTLLSINDGTPLQLTSGRVSDNTRARLKPTTPGDEINTPASTPQGSAFTVSPDPTGQTNAPLTPVPAEAASNVGENDPDAYLVDAADENWGMLLPPNIGSTRSVKSSPALASGLMIRRGHNSAEHLQTLGVALHWDVRLRPNGLVDDGPQRQIEANLREVLKMYRNLSLLTRTRYLNAHDSNELDVSCDKSMELMPIHLFCSIRSAGALDYLKIGHGSSDD